jgi:hypothetical protein
VNRKYGGSSHEDIRFGTVSEQERNVLMNDSDDIWLWHLWEWAEMTVRAWSLENHYLLAEENGKRVGGFPLELAPGSSYG